MQNRKGTFQAKAGLADIAGVEKQDAVEGLRERLVGVAEDDHVGLYAGDLGLEASSRARGFTI